MRKDHVYILISVCRWFVVVVVDVVVFCCDHYYQCVIIQCNKIPFINQIYGCIVAWFRFEITRNDPIAEICRVKNKAFMSWNVANQEKEKELLMVSLLAKCIYFRAHKINQNPLITRRSSNQTVISNDHVHTIRSFSTSLMMKTTKEAMDRTKQRQRLSENTPNWVDENVFGILFFFPVQFVIFTFI